MIRHPGIRPLVLPAALALACFLLRDASPAIAARTGLDAGAEETLRMALGIGAWLSLAWAGARVFDVLVLAAQLARRAPYSRLLGDLVRALLFGAAGLAILTQVFGQSALGVVTTSSVAVAVVGFALRNIISDVFSGIALGVDASYGIGDWIETAEGCAGRVTEVNWRATRLVTRDGVTQVVPNGLIAAHRLMNYGGASAYRIVLRIALDPALPPERAKRVLLSGALDAERNFPGLRPDVCLQDVAEGAAIYLVRFQVPDYGREAACRDAVMEAVLRALQHAGIAIARPGRDVQVARHGAAPAGRAALLRRIPLLHDFSPAERDELARLMEERVVPRGATIVRQGEDGDPLFVVAEGALDVRVRRDDAELALDRMVPGDVFGEMSLLTGQPRSATVSAATEAVILEVQKRDLAPILQRRPELAEGLAAIMAGRRLRNADRGRGAAPAEPAGQALQEDLLGRLRSFFRLG